MRKYQDWFDKAWLGLKAQGFRRADSPNGVCSYAMSDGRKCAWGHVDPVGTAGQEGDVYGLAAQGLGLAATLTGEELAFAAMLQNAHDRGLDSVESRMRAVAAKHSLTIPGE